MVRAFVAGVGGGQLPGPAARRGPAGARSRRRRRPGRPAGRGLGVPHRPVASRSTSEDALTAERVPRRRWRPAGRIADAEIAAGADLLILGDMGIGNTTPAAALIAASFGVGGRAGRRPGHRHRRRAAGPQDRRPDQPPCTGWATGSPTRGPGWPGSGRPTWRPASASCARPARRGVPVLLDGIVSVAELAVAEELEPGRDRLVRGRSPLHRAGPAAGAGEARAGADARSRAAAGRGHGGARSRCRCCGRRRCC